MGLEILKSRRDRAVVVQTSNKGLRIGSTSRYLVRSGMKNRVEVDKGKHGVE